MSLRLVAMLGGVVLLVVVVLWLRSCGAAPAEREAAKARVGQAQAEGQVAAATDATAVTANVMSEAVAIDTQTRTNADAIRKSNGDPAVALRAWCLRPTYRHQPRCVALLGSRPAPTE